MPTNQLTRGRPDSISGKENATSKSTFQDQDCESLILFLIHDLEGPLAAMQSVLRLLESNRFNPGKDTHHNLVISAKSAFERARLIIEDLLTLSKLEEESLPVRLEPTDLSEAINSSLRVVSSSASDQGIHFAIDLPVDSPTVIADKRLLQRVLDNLLYNAVRHTTEEGRIGLQVECEVEQVKVLVTNSGPGFGEIDPTGLFEKFRQLHYRKQGTHKGVGLGLYFCRLAVEAMRGTITAYETEMGEPCFCFSLQKGGVER